MGPVGPQGRPWQVRVDRRQVLRRRGGRQGFADQPGRQVLRPLRRAQASLKQVSL